jgi:hypothetical protein
MIQKYPLLGNMNIPWYREYTSSDLLQMLYKWAIKTDHPIAKTKGQRFEKRENTMLTIKVFNTLVFSGVFASCWIIPLYA